MCRLRAAAAITPDSVVLSVCFFCLILHTHSLSMLHGLSWLAAMSAKTGIDTARMRSEASGPACPVTACLFVCEVPRPGPLGWWSGVRSRCPVWKK